MEKEFKIYKHTSPSGKIYIGQTKAKNPISRWRNGGKGYYRINKFGDYQQPAMVNAINKYPWNEWSHEIIDYCNTLDEANKLEQYYIKLYKSNDSNYGYNITSGGGGHYHQKMSDETKAKLSRAIKEKWKDLDYREKQRLRLHPPMHENTKKALYKANIGKHRSEETKEKIRKSKINYILQFSLEGDLLNTFETAKDASVAIGRTITSITNCCKGISKKCSDYIFLYKKDYDNNNNLILERINNLNTKKFSTVPIIQIEKGGSTIEYESVTEASKKSGIKLTSISNCLRGYSKTAGGYKWIYKNNYNGT